MNMRRAAIGGAVAAGALALTPGTAMAAIQQFDIGDEPGDDGDQFEYLVLSAQNDVVTNTNEFGPRVFFFTQFECTNDERIGMGFLANDPEEGEDARGFTGLARNCTGNTQYVGVVVERRPNSPQFEAGDNESLEVLGVAATDLNDSINSVSFDDDTLTWTNTI
jgi:hypothetical protein